MSNDLNDEKVQLKEELEKLRYEYKVELPKIISHAREYGDLKENAEYHAARERQSFVKAKISQVINQLAQLNDIDVSRIPEDKIAFGSKVKLVNLDSEDIMELQFVSPNEVNPSKGKISLSSPFGVALQDKTAGDEVEIKIPAGIKKFYIEKVVTYNGTKIEKKYEN